LGKLTCHHHQSGRRGRNARNNLVVRNFQDRGIRDELELVGIHIHEFGLLVERQDTNRAVRKKTDRAILDLTSLGQLCRKVLQGDTVPLELGRHIDGVPDHETTLSLDRLGAL